ncbi:MAG: DUF1284 domain-containing protein [Chloroflexi bacterium]|nr:DUF1284 domain-containing protein [Chloroflexota bacterium]
MEYPVKIRGHHLLCLLGFRGLGYSPEFTEALAEIVQKLRSNTSLPITVVTECDVICVSCPHHKEDQCRKKEDSFDRKVRARDAEVLERLSFKPGERTTPQEAWQRVKMKISAAALTEMCQKCEWVGYGYCHEGLAKLAKGEAITTQLDAGSMT